VVRTERSPPGNARGSRDVLPVHQYTEKSVFEEVGAASNRHGGQSAQRAIAAAGRSGKAQGSIGRRLLETEAGATSPVLEESLETCVAWMALQRWSDGQAGKGGEERSAVNSLGESRFW
jgi:hypothetical protein